MKTITEVRPMMVQGRMQIITMTHHIREPGDALPLPLMAAAQAYARLTPEQRAALGDDAWKDIQRQQRPIGSRFD
jgi:TRAP-type C4-dicarboxylate transport system, periplasmic component